MKFCRTFNTGIAEVHKSGSFGAVSVTAGKGGRPLQGEQPAVRLNTVSDAIKGALYTIRWEILGTFAPGSLFFAFGK